MPLVNELVIGLKDKDRFNAQRAEGRRAVPDYVTHPTLPALLEVLFGVTAPTAFPRSDLVQVFLTGVPGLNADARRRREMLRLNTAIAPTPARDAEQPRRARRRLARASRTAGGPGDDVVDIALRVVMGVLLPAADAPSGQLPYTDGAFVDATFFDDRLPLPARPDPGLGRLEELPT